MDTEAFAMILLLAGLLVYLLPMVIVALRDVQGRAAGGIALINLFLGWTLIGWLVAFVWACGAEGRVKRKQAAGNQAAILAALANRQ
jgi:Superinfection immunity protein